MIDIGTAQRHIIIQTILQRYCTVALSGKFAYYEHVPVQRRERSGLDMSQLYHEENTRFEALLGLLGWTCPGAVVFI
jgi:hypothetical protein